MKSYLVQVSSKDGKPAVPPFTVSGDKVSDCVNFFIAYDLVCVFSQVQTFDEVFDSFSAKVSDKDGRN